MPDYLSYGYSENNNYEESKNFCIRSMDDYTKLYKLSIEKPEIFWKALVDEFYWKTKPSGNFYSYNFDPSKGPISIKWMENGITNMCYNALDHNIKNGLGNKIAYHWEGNDEQEEKRSITYRQLLKQVCKFSNVLKAKGVKKGDRVTIYMPMLLETIVAILACSRIGAVHNVVFAGFSSESLAERIINSKSAVLVTADATWRGSKLINLKKLADGALKECYLNHLHVKCIVVRHLQDPQSLNINGYNGHQGIKRQTLDLQIKWNAANDTWWHDEMAAVSAVCEPEWVDSEHPMFILYTSGSTGKPKGVVHSTAGYMLYAATTFQCVFEHKPTDVYFCTADVGWITGHTYGLYGPLLQGATSVLFQGIPTHPDPGRYWATIEKYKVSKFYTAPTAIRTLMKYGDSYVKKYDLTSLEVLGSVGEPINPEAWHWYNTVVGGGKCAIVDTFWQSETGGHVITPIPGCTPLKPGSATLPFFGVVPALLDENGKEIDGPGEGYLVFKKPWPGMMRSLYGNHERFATTYFSKFPGYYCCGDSARRDDDGYYWITGRIDDMLNVSGHLLSTAEVESALVEHPDCVESAVVAIPHPVKGECLYCYVVLTEDTTPNSKLIYELKDQVRSKIGSFATPEYIHFSHALPKTRSGKILRRILRKVANNDQELGDLSTVAEESVIQELFDTRPDSLTA